jgi:RimJ/RimL family protein N-acetyltransferase
VATRAQPYAHSDIPEEWTPPACVSVTLPPRVGQGAGGESNAIVTARLELRPLRVDDAPEMVEVLADESLYDFTGGEPPSLETLRRRYALQVKGLSPDGKQEWRNWVVRLRQPPRPAVGIVQATIVDDGAVAEVAWVIGLPWQGRGFATEASAALVEWLETRGVGTAIAHVHPHHAASTAIARKIGLLPTDVIDDGERLWTRQLE